MCILLLACGDDQDQKESESAKASVAAAEPTGEYADTSTLPAPFESESVQNYSKVIGWKDGRQPAAPAGFTVTKFADSLENPRWIYVAENGDIFVAESATVVKGAKKLEAKFRPDPGMLYDYRAADLV